MRERFDTGYWFVVASFVVALGVAAFVSFAPTVVKATEAAEVSVSEAGREPPPPEAAENETLERGVTRQTLPEAQGSGAVGIIAGPLLLLTGLPLLVTRRRVATVVRTVSTTLLFAGVVLGALSFGIFYLSVAVLMLIATILAFEKPRQPIGA